ncbi:MAG: hypothetical protein C0404_01525 [Verrucomicrobia bacterium]|nr:hypothetical protein [Verrucomicrobiota bacterium]
MTDTIKEFEARYPEEARREIAAHLLEKSLVELMCTECGKTAFTVDTHRSHANFECPVCRKRTFVRNAAGGISVVSESRLLKLVSYVRTRKWYCAEHDGVQAEVTGVELAADGFTARLTYNCRRRSRMFKSRVHSGERQVDLLALEAEMGTEG